MRVSASGSTSTPAGGQQHGLHNWGSSGSGSGGNSFGNSSAAAPAKKSVEDILKLYDAPQQQHSTFSAHTPHAGPHAGLHAYHMPAAARAGPGGMVPLQQQLQQQHLQQGVAPGFRHHPLSAMMPVTPSNGQ
jgi:hypothetical protein